MADLVDLQYELGEGFLFGRGTPFTVERMGMGTPDGRYNDRERPREDGIMFGRDFLNGRTITFDGHVVQTSGWNATLDNITELEAAWLSDEIRLTPGAVTSLRMKHGSHQRVVYGRPRRFAAVKGRTKQGIAPFTADFVCIDHRFYGDVEESETITFVPPISGGIVAPVDAPVSTVGGSTSRQGDIVIGGTQPAFTRFTIHGPITNPVITVLNRWTIRMTLSLAYDDYVVIDPRPWGPRGVRTRFGVNAAGKFTADSPMLSKLQLPPGPHTVTLSGTDPTATSWMTVAWNPVYASF